DKYKLKAGDSLSLKWGDQNYVDTTIYGFIDYWPSLNPYSGTEKERAFFIIGNLKYFQDATAIQPYFIWIKKKPGATDEQVYNDIKKQKLEVDKVDNTNQLIIKKKNDPLLQGINGVLTLGFVVTMIISTIGFLIYWVISIRMRVMQFGIFRAIGLPLKKVIGMIVCEQVLISGIAIFMGILIGSIASSLFVPLLQLVYSAAEQVPPFKVIAYGSDYIKIYIVVLSMLTFVFAVLFTLISRIRIDQVLKLGED
ncbi:MAG: ABC transporter permease, partial [Bacillota bacterium]